MKQKQLDEMTEQLGKAMRQGRNVCKIAPDDAAMLLFSPTKTKYSRCVIKNARMGVLK